MAKGIKTWSVSDRPREKMIEKGVFALSDAELIAIILASGNSEETAVDLARRILNDYDNDLQRLSKQSFQTFCSYKGIKTAKAVTLMAALELGNRRIMAPTNERLQIHCANDAFQCIYPYLNNRAYEEFWTIYVDINLNLITTKLISSGGTSSTTFDIKKIYKIALDETAHGIIVCHNHPSNNLTPSADDQNLTEKLKESCRVLGLQFIDHLIIGNGKYYSFKDHEKPK